jgi:hypothetical protein
MMTCIYLVFCLLSCIMCNTVSVGIRFRLTQNFGLECRHTLHRAHYRAHYNVYQRPQGDCPGANRGRFLRHCSFEDPAENTHRTFPSGRSCLDYSPLQVIHKNFKISRIRNFYMRKVKFTQDSFEEKLSSILSEFPMLDVCLSFCFCSCLLVYAWDVYRTCIRSCPP